MQWSGLPQVWSNDQTCISDKIFVEMKFLRMPYAMKMTKIKLVSQDVPNCLSKIMES